MDSKNAEQLTVSLLEAPVTFIESFSGTIAMKPLPPDQIFSYSTSREISPSSPSDFHSLLSSEISCQACPAQNIVLSAAYPLGHLQIPGRQGPRVTYERTHIGGKEDPRSSQNSKTPQTYAVLYPKSEEEPSCPNTVTPRETGKP